MGIRQADRIERFLAEVAAVDSVAAQENVWPIAGLD